MKLPDAFSPDVMTELARPVMTFDWRNAEMRPDLAPTWHVIQTYERADRPVADELSSRRFGIFMPEEAKTEVKRGRKIDTIRPMFPGYIFVFVWLTAENYTRIRGTPGVLQFLCDVGRPVVIPDDMIDQIRAVENGQRPLHRPKKKRGYSRNRDVSENDIISCRAWSPFQDQLMALDSEGRNQTLRKALGLSLVPST